tara:strand:- start:262 stop:636 length:375 start_codon:yes stop_codon:yes gene_type:complete
LSKDPNYAIKVERAIAEKYGDEAVRHPKSDWTDDKEKQYLDDLKKLHHVHNSDDESLVDINGVLISKKLLRRESKRSCPVCSTYSFKSKDDVYMSKFGCCEKCYIQWIEGREDRWKKGWRPNNG